MDLHPNLEPIRFLLGTWSGAGAGRYPTITPFEYTEDATYVAGGGKPFVFYTQRTLGSDGLALHAEAGYLRMTAEGPELIIAQPTGLTEIHRGKLTGTGLEFRSDMVHASRTAKAVGAVERRLLVEDDTLSYTLDMAYSGHPLSLHLEATLHRS